GEDLSVNRIAQGGDQAIHARLHFFDDQALRRSFGLGIDFQVVSFVAKNVKGVSDVAGGKNSDSLAHAVRLVYRRPDVWCRKVWKRGFAPLGRGEAPSPHDLLLASFRTWSGGCRLGMMADIGSQNPEDDILGN